MDVNKIKVIAQVSLKDLIFHTFSHLITVAAKLFVNIPFLVQLKEIKNNSVSQELYLGIY